MATLIQNGVVLTKANIAFLKKCQEENRKEKKAPKAKAPDWGGIHGKKPRVKKSHAERRAGVVARSIAADPKNKTFKK